jgi:ribonuclease P/MRP protein subunit POP3
MPQFDTFRPLLNSVPVLAAPWLCPASKIPRTLVPTHIKQLKTNTPKDMRAAKEMRMRSKVAAKEKGSRVAKVPKRIVIVAS